MRRCPPYSRQKHWHQNQGRVIGQGNSKTFSGSGGGEFLFLQHGLESTHDRFQFPQDAFSPNGPLVSTPSANEEWISQGLAQPIQRTAHRGLTQKTPFGSAGDVPFL